MTSAPPPPAGDPATLRLAARALLLDGQTVAEVARRFDLSVETVDTLAARLLDPVGPGDEEGRHLRSV